MAHRILKVLLTLTLIGITGFIFLNFLGQEHEEEITGPGGCKGIECETFCSKPENQKICREWCLENPDVCRTPPTREQPRRAIVTFRVIVPEQTPPEDTIYINIPNPHRMKKVDENIWQKTLLLESHPQTYFYSRGQLGEETEEEFLNKTGQWEKRKRRLEITSTEMQINDTVEKWRWLPLEKPRVNLLDPSGIEFLPRVNDEKLRIGGAFMDFWWESFSELIEPSMEELKQMKATSVMLTPTWILTEENGLPVLWEECGYCHYNLTAIGKHVEEARKRGLSMTFKLQMSFDERITVDFANKSKEWVDAFFNEKKKFIRKMAEIGVKTGVEIMIVSNLYDVAVARANYPGNSDEAVRQRIKGLVEVASNYSGKLAFEGTINPEDLRYVDVNDFDYFAVSLWQDLTDKNDPTLQELEDSISRIIDTEIKPTYELTGKPIFFESIPYPSIDGGNRINLVSQKARSYGLGSDPYDPTFEYDLQEQVDIYNALMNSIAKRPWIVGFYTFSYWYIDMIDKASNIRAKPAADQLKLWLETID
jgi:hypothetical protein